ncbi:hypothetical protein EIP91_011352 [Steccherinum ochraceum]|uniref:Uncharacterized protein n=1 Tax=Steccherinum ochraceum TaxID=92696 RepID=A0A4R0R295_9APHY|nr:hypothetical protein EIP91_011352 [Steccherinum ochraceum]
MLEIAFVCVFILAAPFLAILSIFIFLFIWPTQVIDIDDVVDIGSYFYFERDGVRLPFPFRSVCWWFTLFLRTAALLSWSLPVTYVLAAHGLEPVETLHLFSPEWRTVVRLMPLSMRIFLAVCLHSYRASLVWRGLSRFTEDVRGLLNFTERKYRRLRRTRRQIEHHIFGEDTQDLSYRLPAGSTALIHTFGHPRRLTVVLQGWCQEFATTRSPVAHSAQILSALFDGTLKFDGYSLDWKVLYSAEDKFKASVRLSLRRCGFARFLDWKEDKRVFTPGRYLSLCPDGTLAAVQTLDGVPPRLLSSVLKSLVFSLEPRASVILDFSALGPTVPSSSILYSDLLLAAALALTSHGFIRNRLLDDDEAAKTISTIYCQSVCSLYDCTLPLFVSAERVMHDLRQLKAPGVEFALRETSAEHVEVLEERLWVLERSLPPRRPVRDKYEGRDLVLGSIEDRRELFLSMLMVEIVKRGLLTRWEVVLTRSRDV